MEYCSTIKGKKILLFVKTWENLESIMINEISQRQILYVLIYMGNQKIPKLIERKNGLVVARGGVCGVGGRNM